MNRSTFLRRLALFPCLAIPGLGLRGNETVPKSGFPTTGLVPPPPIPEWLDQWRRKPRIPIWDDGGGNDGIWLAAIEAGVPMTIFYDKYLEESETRHITPALLFQVEGYEKTYLEAWDHDKQAWRHFDTEKIMPVFDNKGRQLEDLALKRRKEHLLQ